MAAILLKNINFMGHCKVFKVLKLDKHSILNLKSFYICFRWDSDADFAYSKYTLDGFNKNYSRVKFLKEILATNGKRSPFL